MTDLTCDVAAGSPIGARPWGIMGEIRHRLGWLKWKLFPGKSNLERHAERELSRLTGDPDGDDMQQAMNKHILRMVRTFARKHHSGSSAGYAVGILQKLLRYEPLGPITDDPAEWQEISEEMGEVCWQNRRCSHVFKGADGRAYDINGRVFVEPNGVSFTGRGSCVYVTLPYTPHTEYVDVGEDGEPLSGPSREELAKGTDLADPA